MSSTSIYVNEEPILGRISRLFYYFYENEELKIVSKLYKQNEMVAEESVEWKWKLCGNIVYLLKPDGEKEDYRIFDGYIIDRDRKLVHYDGWSFYGIRSKRDEMNYRTGYGKTFDLACKDARNKLPPNSKVFEFEQMNVFKTGHHSRVSYGKDEFAARISAEYSFDDHVLVENVKLKRSGRKGFLGIGKEPNEYIVEIFQQFIVKVYFEIN